MAEATETKPNTEAIAVTRRIQRPGIKEPRVEKLRRVIDEASDAGPFSIIVAQIDPDAIGSAFGMQELLSLLGQTSTIYYQGKVGHPQNEALCNKFGLMGRMKALPSRYDTEPGDSGRLNITLNNPILVDSSRANDSRLPFPISPVIVVDHHGQSDVGEESVNTFFWVDESAGSACTMVAEILSEISPENWEIKPDLAVLLALGIYTDCKDGLRTGDRDDSAYSWVKRYANSTDLINLIRYKRPFSFLRNLAHAVSYVEKYDTYRKGRIMGGLGRIPDKQGDDLAMVADELLRTVGAPLALTWAMVEVKDSTTGNTTTKIRVCARSEDYTTNLAEALGTPFGNKSGAKTLPDGTAEGGALMEFPGLDPWLKDGEMEEFVNKRFIEWFFGSTTATSDSE
jgi:nanoRNase/pAp phosphatase (c-di-AMP/oligoRNAs hydrolase)